MQLTSTGPPAQVVDAPRWVTRWTNRKCFNRLTSLAPLRDAPPVVPQPIEPGPGHSAVPLGVGRQFTRSPNPAIDAKGRAYRRLTTTSNDLWAALVDEQMAQLHECAMPIGKFFASA